MSEQNCAKHSTSTKGFNVLKNIKFIIISYALCLIMILALTALVVYTDIPQKAGDIGVKVITILGSFFSAYLCGRSRQKGGLVWGMANGGAYAAGLILLGIAIYGFVPDAKMVFSKMLAGCIAGAFGGIIGVNTARG